MTPVISSSINNLVLIPGTPFETRRNGCLQRCIFFRISTKQTRSSQKYVLPVSVRSFPQPRSGFVLQPKSRIGIISATETDLAVEEADSPVADEDSKGTSEESSAKSENRVSPPQIKRTRPGRKSEMPPVQPEELVPGALFTGKVRSIQPFGAFIDFGGFTDGLVHVSQLSDSFVKDVGTVVSVGQEVKVKLLEANTETGRISLTMRLSDAPSKPQQRQDTPSSSEKSRPPRKNTGRPNQKKDEVKETSKFVNGQQLEGTVKNLTRSGAFISLPEGGEGFLPISEEFDEGLGNVMLTTSLEVGQEVSVRVLRTSRGQVTLTMKKDEDVGELDRKLNQGVVYKASNPFMLAFRKNRDIAAFLDEREKGAEPIKSPEIPQTSDEMELKSSQIGEVVAGLPEVEEISSKEVGLEASTVEDALSEVASEIKNAESIVSDSSAVIDGVVQSIEEEVKATSEILAPVEPILNEVASEMASTVEDALSEVASEIKNAESIVSDSLAVIDGVVQSIEEEVKATSEILAPVEPILNEVASEMASTVEDALSEVASEIKNSESIVSDSSMVIDGVVQSIEEELKATSEILAPVESINTSDQLIEEVPIVDKVENGGYSDLPAKTADQSSSESLVSVQVSPVFNSLQSVDSEAKSIEVKVEASSEVLSPEASASAIEEVSTIGGLESLGESDLSGQTADPIMSESVVSKEVIETQAGDAITKDEVEISNPDAGNEIISATIVEDEKVEISPEENGVMASSSAQIDVPTVVESAIEESQVVEELKNEIDRIEAKEELKNGTPVLENEIPSAVLVEDEKVGSVPAQNGTVTNSNGQNGAPSLEESTIKAISPALVKQLREETGAGMMDCKKALSETGGDLVLAHDFLRKKGLANADKKSSRATAEGRIGSYVHDSRIGVLIEVNCETDFVSRGEIFKELVDDLAMQVAACPQVQYLATEDVPKEIVEKEKEIEMQKEDLLSKPEQIRAKIVEGRIRKRLEELALLEQPYIKNDKMVVKDLVKQTIATIGENMKVKRFMRYNLGEGLEKKSQDFAAEVAAQTAAKPVPSPGKEQPSVVAVDSSPKATISAALVKQLREETGAGMMDCKKALSETGGDLKLAEGYLRKKGLSAADKKSSRLAAEGRIGSYLHDSRIGVLIEVNCETDFVGRSEKFKELADDLAMQVVACPPVQYVSIEEIPESVVRKEKELEMQREDLASKPENIREKIVEGRVSKRLGELVLLEQPFIKNDGILVKDLVKQTVAALGENIKVRRFVRFTLGETIKSAATEVEA